MKRKILIAVMAILPCFVFAQSSDPNIGIGLGDPIFGINLKINFPGLTGGWSRGYSISNHDRSKQFIMFGTMGSANNGISTQSYSFIGQDWYNAYMVFRPDGNIGIGTTEVENSEGWNRVLQVKGEFHAKSIVSSSQRTTGVWSHNTGYYGAPAGGVLGTASDHPVSVMTNSSTKMTILPNGNVGIGTIAPQELLSVNGSIRAHEIKVQTSNWPDYVFNPAYELKPLQDVARFISVHGHLPDVPKAQLLEKEGISVGQVNEILMKKVEELTLYLIEKDLELKECRDLLKENTARLERLESIFRN